MRCINAVRDTNLELAEVANNKETYSQGDCLELELERRSNLTENRIWKDDSDIRPYHVLQMVWQHMECSNPNANNQIRY